MALKSQTIRILISSPGNVDEERNGAKRVIEAMQKSYPRAILRPVLWEELALPATASFQETIDLILEREPIDIAVFIVWARLGSPLGPAITKPDGSSYRSGTEREFDLMVAAFEQSGRKKPLILAYIRVDHEAFTQKLNTLSEDELREAIKQRRDAESFVAEQFYDSEGRNLRPYHEYKKPVSFSHRLRVHLRRAIDDLLELESVTWTEEPYRALQTFEINHAPIFYGREEESCDLLQLLRDQQQTRCAFIVLVGASGSGKSSLARAGIAANLVQHPEDDGVHWRVSVFIPTLAYESLHHGLVRTFADFIPDLKDSNERVDSIARRLASTPDLTADLTKAFVGKSSRLLLILDQLEELWTNRNLSEENRERFLISIRSLARSGHVAVLATLRSDFYHQAQASPTFLSLKGRQGHYDLIEPDTVSLQRLITEPARLSGLTFEFSEKMGRSLDETILQDAAGEANALPLLEYTLSELYRKRDQDRRMLTYSSYIELGGVAGAIGKRAEDTYACLSKKAQCALSEILPLLVSVDCVGEQAAVRRRAAVTKLMETPERVELTTTLIDTRFLTIYGDGETKIASLAHEALLSCWFRISDWISVNRKHLRLRAQLESLHLRWEQQGRDDSLLLAEGLPLDEGMELRDKASHLLTDSLSNYIRDSIDLQLRISKHSRRRRIAVLSTITVLLLIMIFGGIYIRRSTKSSQLVQGLLQAKTSKEPAILVELSRYQMLAKGELLNGFTQSANGSDAKLHAALALLGKHDAATPFLKKRLLQVSASQFQIVCDALYDHKDDLIDDYTDIAKNSGVADQIRFRAACALASYAPENTCWTDEAFTAWVADCLTGIVSSEFLPWRDALREVRAFLIKPLKAIYREDTQTVMGRVATADTLSDYLREDPDQLFDLLADASENQFNVMFDKLLKHRERAIELGNLEIANTIMTDVITANIQMHATRKANAAIMLLRMDAVESVWPLLRQNEDPSVRNYFIHWVSPRGGDAAELMARLQQETDVTVRRALLLSLGEFNLNNTQNRPLI